MKKILLLFLTLTTINQTVLPHENPDLKLLSGISLVLGSILIFHTYTRERLSWLSKLLKGGSANFTTDFNSLATKKQSKTKRIRAAYTHKKIRPLNKSKTSLSKRKSVNHYQSNFKKALNDSLSKEMLRYPITP